jgi:hypothetical protein
VAQNEAKEGHTLEVERDSIFSCAADRGGDGAARLLLAEDPKYLQPYDTAIAQLTRSWSACAS